MKTLLCLGMTTVALAGACSAAEMTEVRVRQTSGGPKIFVDGQAMNPRVCYTRSVMKRIPIAQDWRKTEYVSTMACDMKALHYSITADWHEQQSNPEFRNFAISNATTGKVISRPLQEVTPKDGSLKKQTSRRWVAGSLCGVKRGDRLVISFEARADVATYVWPGLYQQQRGFDVYTYYSVQVPPDDYKLTTGYGEAVYARQNGVRIFTPYFPNCWRPEGEQNFEPFDKEVDLLLSAVPDAIFFPRISANAPTWWLDAHPEARALYDDGKSSPEFPSIHSRIYRQEATRYIERCVKHLMAKYPKNFGGIQIGGQACGEWNISVGPKRMFTGFCKAAGDAYHAWRAAKGLPPADVPNREIRCADETNSVVFIDMAKRSSLAEYYDFLRIEMADCLGGFAHAARVASQGKKMVIAFYSYQYEHMCRYQGPGPLGTYGLEHLLANYRDDLDILAAPITYSDRGWLGTCPVIGTAETIARNGILWMNEDDFRTPDATLEGFYHDAEHMKEPIYCWISDFGQMRDCLLRSNYSEAIRGIGEWWMDLGGTGWFDRKSYWDVIGDTSAFDAKMLACTSRYEPEVIMTLDEASAVRLCGRSGTPGELLTHGGRKYVPRAGVTSGQYLYHDAINDVPVHAKMFVHYASYLDEPKSAARIAELRTSRPELTHVWCWAPGYVSATGYTTEGVKRLTGFDVVPKTFKTMRTKATPAGLREGLESAAGLSYQRGPTLAVQALPSDEVWATWEDGSAAIVLRKNPNGRGYDVFCGQPDMSAALYRALADRAGVHAYFDRDRVDKAVVFATEGAACVQSFETAKFDFIRPDGTRVPLDLRKGEVKLIQ